jgi:hypothetical protein
MQQLKGRRCLRCIFYCDIVEVVDEDSSCNKKARFSSFHHQSDLAIDDSKWIRDEIILRCCSCIQ